MHTKARLHWTPYIKVNSSGNYKKITYNEHDIYYATKDDSFPVSLQRMLQNSGYKKQLLIIFIST